jgi:hypothetical protein
MVPNIAIRHRAGNPKIAVQQAPPPRIEEGGVFGERCPVLLQRTDTTTQRQDYCMKIVSLVRVSMIVSPGIVSLGTVSLIVSFGTVSMIVSPGIVS